MFENVGEKIKSLARLFAVIGIIASVIVAFVFFVNANFWTGLLIAVVGSFVSWGGSLLIYGFGELIVQTTKIADGKNKKKVKEHKMIDFGAEGKETEEAVTETDINTANADECPKCFSKINKDDKECSYCGYKFKK